ncbi:hypothetical protein [Nonomuraea longicatena]|uniref:hypothetical protein n=1 Tax=Nonomuraea longicatena TaxID=83682 RepID=UPI0031D08AF7
MLDSSSAARVMLAVRATACRMATLTHPAALNEQVIHNLWTSRPRSDNRQLE